MIACDGEEVELLGTSEGAAAGKHQSDDSRPKYGWSDGKKQVSAYIELVPSSSTSSPSQAIILKFRVSNLESQTLSCKF